MRVCSPQMGLAPDANLGGAVYDRELLRGLVKLGVSVDVLLPIGEHVDSDVGWHITRTPRHRRSYYEYNYIFLKALRRQWRERPADVLRVHSPYSVGPGALIFARTLGVPVALHYLHREPRHLWSAVDAITLNRYDVIVTISEATRVALVQAGACPGRIVVAYPGVDDSYSPGVRPPRSYLQALHVGSLIARKNVSLALRAVAAVRQRGIDLRLVLVGAGNLDSQLRREAADLRIDAYVDFRGIVPHDQKMRLLRESDLFLFPSRLEGFGMAAAEALACGTPVIGMRMTSTPEIVKHGETGLLLDDPESVVAMAEAIVHLATSAEKRREMGRCGAVDVRERFSWTRSAQAVLSAYESIARAPRMS